MKVLLFVEFQFSLFRVALNTINPIQFSLNLLIRCSLKAQNIIQNDISAWILNSSSLWFSGCNTVTNLTNPISYKKNYNIFIFEQHFC